MPQFDATQRCNTNLTWCVWSGSIRTRNASPRVLLIYAAFKPFNHLLLLNRRGLPAEKTCHVSSCPPSKTKHHQTRGSRLSTAMDVDQLQVLLGQRPLSPLRIGFFEQSELLLVEVVCGNFPSMALGMLPHPALLQKYMHILNCNSGSCKTFKHHYSERHGLAISRK